MKIKEATPCFEILSSEIRLRIFRLLVRYGTNGLVAGEIAQHLDIPSTNLSFHLKTMMHSGLVSMEKEGRFLRYRANIPLMLELVAFLTSECCSGHPEQCREFRATHPEMEPFLPPVTEKKSA